MMLEVRGLGFDYPDRAHDFYRDSLLKEISFTAPAGTLLHLRGSNGSGKTTLLKLLAGILHQEEGDIRYCGQSIITNLGTYQRKLCYVGHKTGISSALTVLENCQFDLQNRHQTHSFDDLLQQFSLFELKDTLCGLLSAGQRRRVGLLRLIISNASLWLLDEPLIALDQEGMTLLMSCFELHLKQGGQVVLTSHQQLSGMIEDYQEFCL